jgi:two-component system, LytTR family, response regulator
MKKVSHKLLVEKEIIKTDSFAQKGQKIILKEKNINHFIRMDTITHLMCDCYLTTVYTENGCNYVIAKLLKEFELELSSYGFVRVNRNTIINILHIVRYKNLGNRTVLLTNGVLIDISRRGMARLKEAIGL